MSIPKFNVNILLLGNAGCGKSTFINAIFQGLGANRIHPDTFEVSRRDRSYILKIYENHVQTQRSPDSTSATVAVLCYDIGDRTSLKLSQQYWHHELAKANAASIDDLMVMLVGLKRDKRVVEPSNAIDTQEALKIAGEMRAALYAECSAKSGELMRQVAEDFLKTLRATVDRSQNSDTYSYCIVI